MAPCPPFVLLYTANERNKYLMWLCEHMIYKFFGICVVGCQVRVVWMCYLYGLLSANQRYYKFERPVAADK